jgi:hypothetical protein
MMRKKILFVCGSLNQTTQMHQISVHLREYERFFTPYYADGIVDTARRLGLLEFTILGRKLASMSLDYLQSHHLAIDYGGIAHDYDLVVTCADLIIPRNIRGRRIVLVQEGMTDPENWVYHLARLIPIPRYLASTSTMGLSHAYDYFCVGSEGYRDLFVRKGVDPARIVVTGIPNFDNCARFLDNDFPHHGYVLACTSDARETFKWENRKAFIQKCVALAGGRKLIFKLHPNENHRRATGEINRWAPDALVFTAGDANHMVANCETLVTLYSTLAYIGIALGKDVYSAFDVDELRKLVPIQNGGTSAIAVAEVCRRHIERRTSPPSLRQQTMRRTQFTRGISSRFSFMRSR